MKTDMDDIRHPKDQFDHYGHRHIEDQLFDAIRKKRLPHALLFVGQKGVGKCSMAFRLARFLAEATIEQTTICEPEPSQITEVESRPFQCAKNKRIAEQISNRSYPDLRLVERELDPKSKKLKTKITVEQIRDLIPFFLQSASAANGWKIAIIDSTDNLNHFSANALLKMLEEPPQKSLIILICHNAGELPQTLQSRCTKFRFGALTDQEITQLQMDLSGLDISKSLEGRKLMALSQGVPGSLENLLRYDGWALYHALIDNCYGLPHINASGVQKLIDVAISRQQPQKYDLLCNLIFLLWKRVIFTVHGHDRFSSMTEEKKLSGNLVNRISAYYGQSYGRTLTSLAVFGFWQVSQSLLREQALYNLDKSSTLVQLFRSYSEITRTPVFSSRNLR